MRTPICNLVLAGLVGVLATGEAFAQRGAHGGPRGPSGGRPAAAAGHAPAGKPGPSGPQRTPDGSLGVRNPAGPKPPAQRHTAYGWTDARLQPFSPAWYVDHPGAWQATHPHADAAAALTVAEFGRWFGVRYPYAAVGGTVVIGDTGTIVTEGPATAAEVAPQPASPTDLARLGAAETAADAEWMTVGTFALKATGETKATRVVQLAVSRDGVIRGSQYDLLSDDVHTVRGAVDKKAMRAAWTIGSSGKTVLETSLAELTKPEGSVTVYFPDGSRAVWQMVQMAPAGR